MNDIMSMVREERIEGQYEREVSFTRENIDVETRTADLAFSSEEPFERFFGMEILDHAPKSIRLGRLQDGGPLLVNHDRDDLIGVVEKVSIGTDRVGRATVRFGKSARAEEIFQDVVDGIRGKVSVGYAIHATKTENEEEVKKGAIPQVRVIDWEPFEISIVSIPADTTVGVGRQDEPETKEDETMLIKKIDKRLHEPDKGEGGGGTATADAPQVDVKEVQEKARTEELARCREIETLGSKFNVPELARKFITTGASADEFRVALLESMGAEQVIDPSPETGLSQKETESFSIVRAMQSIIKHNDLRDAPFEREASEATYQKYRHESNDARKFMVPFEVQNQRMDLTQVHQRDLSTQSQAAGAATIPTPLLTGSFIDLLRNLMIVRQLGARVLGGLTGQVAIPRQTGGATAFWVPEGGSGTESQPAFDQVALVGKTVTAFVDITRKLLLESAIDVEAFVRTDLAMIVALEEDRVAINGTGANDQPLGVRNTTGIGAVVGGTNGAAPDFQDMIDLEKEVAIDNALMGNLAYLTNAAARAKLKATLKAAATAGFIWENNMVNGYPAHASNQVPSDLTKGTGTDLSSIIFGNWMDLIIGEWGTVEIMVDPYTQATAGTVRVLIFKSLDIAVRHPESFAVMDDAITV